MDGPALRIRLFGELDLRHGEAPLPPVESTRAASLLAHLLLHREAPQARQRLAFLLWPDSTDAQAQPHLRHVLHNPRRALPDLDRFLGVTPRTLQWPADAPFWLDVAAFEATIARADQEAGNAGEWLLGERERLRRGYLEALARLTTLLDAGGE